jgi:hypothetical protein
MWWWWWWWWWGPNFQLLTIVVIVKDQARPLLLHHDSLTPYFVPMWGSFYNLCCLNIDKRVCLNCFRNLTNRHEWKFEQFL